jgi:hypothetical protein
MAIGRKTGGGSRKGVPNKATADLKDMILGALDNAGGVDYLTRQATKSPGAFLTLIGKVLPTTLQGTGPAGAIIIATGVRRLTDADIHPAARADNSDPATETED